MRQSSIRYFFICPIWYNNNMEKRKEFIINALYIAVIFAIVYISVNYLLGVLFPFLLGFLFAYIALRIRRRFLTDDAKWKRCLVLLGLYIAIILVLVLLISLGVTKLGDFIRTLPGFYKNTLEPYISQIENSLLQVGQNLPENISAVFNNVTDGIFEGLKSLLTRITTGLVNFTTSLITSAPELLVSFVVMIVSSFYMVSDYENISRWFVGVMPDKVMSVLVDVKDFCENTLFKIIGSYAAIMGLTFIELFIGLSVFGISNSGMWAAVISVLDILPVLGVGTVLIPWGVSGLITGKILLGFEILGMYLVITVIRNIVEPRLVGTNLGLHPLATLMSMICGVRLFGAFGMFGLPLALSFLVSHNKENPILLRPEKPVKQKPKKKTKIKTKKKQG